MSVAPAAVLRCDECMLCKVVAAPGNRPLIPSDWQEEAPSILVGGGAPAEPKHFCPDHRKDK